MTALAPSRVVSRADERTLDRIHADANLAQVPLTEAVLWNEDNVPGMAERLDPQSVDLCITSIPFGALFMYSGKPEDIGNNFDAGSSGPNDMRTSNFGLHMRFHIEQLYRVLAPGALACVHVQQLLTTKVQHGFMGRRDFRGSVVDLYSAGGFEWAGEFVISKNPQRAAQAQSIHSLLFVTGLRDSRVWAPYVNDYVLLFRKPGEGRPVRALYDAERNPAGWVTREEWIRDACGVWTDIRETDVLDGWKGAGEEDDEKHVCLARDSLVLTRDGYMPIQDVGVGQMVLSHQGNWCSVTAKRCNGVAPVIRTEAQGVAALITTPDHRLWTRQATRSHPRVEAMRARPEWVHAGNTLGSYVNLKLPPIEPSELTADEWWIVGRWLGDGHLSTRGLPHLSCAREEADALLARLGKHAGQMRRTKTATQIYIKDRIGRHGGRIHQMIHRCGVGAAGKRVPAEALALTPPLAEALLAGYLSADGHYVPLYQRWTASSVSRALVLGMAMVAQRARDVVASVYAGRPAGTAIIQGRAVRTQQDWVLSIPPKNLSAFMLEDGAWKKVRAIEPVGNAEVWDLQVDGDHSFVAEGCAVHNCPLQLEVIRRCMKLYSNPGDLVLDPFGGIGSTCAVAIELGRNVVQFELKESYHQQALRHVRDAREARQHPPTRDLFSDLSEAAD